MGSLVIRSISTKWWSYNPSANYSYESESMSGTNSFESVNNSSFMGFGFEWPSTESLATKKITGIKFYVGNLGYYQRYFNYKDKYSYTTQKSHQSIYKTDVNATTEYEDQPWPPGSFVNVSSACPFYEYSGNRFRAITYNNSGSYGAINVLQTGNINNGAKFSEAQLNFAVNAWAKGHCIGSTNYAGNYTTYSDYATGSSVNLEWYKYYNRKQYRVYYIPQGSAYLEVEYEDIETKLTPLYPIDVNVKSGNQTTFTWSLTSSGTSSIGTITQTSYKLVITDPDGVSTTYTETTSNQYKTFEPDTFETGTYSYVLSVTSSDGVTRTTSSIPFYVIGGTDAPTITSVSNTSIPTVTWTATYQDAVELKLSQNGVNIWDSGLLAGPSRTSYQIPKMLEDGDYTVELRLLNTYGYYTDYVSKAFKINPTKPTAPTNVFAFANDKFGIEITGTPNATGDCYVVRREAGTTDWEILGKYTEGFIDYKQKANKYYEYTLRTYDKGFADGEWQLVVVKVPEVVIHDGRDAENLVEVSITDETRFEIERSENVSKTFIQCLGRPYPIKELGEWITSTRVFDAYVSNENYTKLIDLSINAPKVYFKATDEFVVCDLEVKDRGTYIQGGRLVKLTMTQIEPDLEVVL